MKRALALVVFGFLSPEFLLIGRLSQEKNECSWRRVMINQAALAVILLGSYLISLGIGLLIFRQK